jgi:hypothetical protein
VSEACEAEKHATVIERDAPLSRSRLWDLQRRWFELAGERAWSEDVLPSYVTTNPTMGAALAELVAAWVADGGAHGQPVTILELGAGTGRLAWHVARALAQVPHVVPRFRYILSDLPERTRAWWAQHPQLAARPELAFARFDAEADGELDAIPPGPLVVIATYLFDSLRCDAFAIAGGALHEKRVTLLAPDGCDLDGEHALGQVARAWSTAPVTLPHYGDPDLDGVLGSYAALPDGELTFPIAGLRCLRRLERRAGGRLLVLAADKGFTDAASYAGRTEPDMTHHGCISVAVNLHAFAADAARRGAVALATGPTRNRLAAIALAHGAPRTEHLRRAFAERFGHAGPDDWYLIKRAVERRYDDCDLDELLAIVRTSRGDDNIVRGAAYALFDRACGALPSQLPALRAAMTGVLDAYYWIGEPADLPLLAGVGLHMAGDVAGARAAWQRGLDLYARAPRPCYRLVVGGLWIGEPDDPRAAAVEAEPLYADLRTKLTTRV